MPKYVIERELAGASDLTPEQLKEISQTSCDVLGEIGPKIQWVHSYVTEDKIYCIYNAPNESKIREHAEKGGFPLNKISKVSTIIDPVTAE
ncbi:DUF4242 domain-containing protein [Tenacibaculum sp. SDUM215027]|uniref:DUF4242 domain-containing protein n=1 Tax=Tenacibaculum sp. SDUM215027 TaxID=3422596 RepID=UPI003D3145F5